MCNNNHGKRCPSSDGRCGSRTSATAEAKVQEHGVSVLWKPANGTEIVADVIFVHGLGGQPRRTWQYCKAKTPATEGTSDATPKKPSWNIFRKENKSESEKGKTGAAPEPSSPPAVTTSEPDSQHCFWPYDLIPDSFGNVRILTYGYDSHPSHFYTGRTVQMNISQDSQQRR